MGDALDGVNKKINQNKEQAEKLKKTYEDLSKAAKDTVTEISDLLSKFIQTLK